MMLQKAQLSWVADETLQQFGVMNEGYSFEY